MPLPVHNNIIIRASDFVDLALFAVFSDVPSSSVTDAIAGGHSDDVVPSDSVGELRVPPSSLSEEDLFKAADISEFNFSIVASNLPASEDVDSGAAGNLIAYRIFAADSSDTFSFTSPTVPNRFESMTAATSAAMPSVGAYSQVPVETAMNVVLRGVSQFHTIQDVVNHWADVGGNAVITNPTDGHTITL